MHNNILTSRENNKYLLVPAKPAPNGRLHLGHASGPYLRLDMLARHLRRKGNLAMVICGTDPYDSFIPLRAHQEKIGSENLAKINYNGIKQDLISLDIEMSAFIDPLDSRWQKKYFDHHSNLVKKLIYKGHTELVDEYLPYSLSQNKYVTGSWLLGNCPQCESPVAGYFCENCGAHLQPHAIISPKFRWNNEQLVNRIIKNLFFTIPDTEILLDQLKNTGVASEFLNIVKRHLKHQGLNVRLTECGNWGIPWLLQPQNETRILFGHGLLFAYCLLLGEIYSDMTGDMVNPFSKGSDVITVNGFGIDNTISHMVSLQSMAIFLNDYKPFDKFIINHFYNLQGKKFSTSTRHLIWVDDIITKTHTSSDFIRYYLALTNPTNSESNFDIDKFVPFLNDTFMIDLGSTLDNMIAAIKKHDAVKDIPNTISHLLTNLLLEQEQGFKFEIFDPRIIANTIDTWLKFSQTLMPVPFNTAYWWLKGLSFLAAPLMPKLAKELWYLTGHENPIVVSELLEKRNPRLNLNITKFKEIAVNQIKSLCNC